MSVAGQVLTLAVRGSGMSTGQVYTGVDRHGWCDSDGERDGVV